jgi:hypothetical protein
MKIFGITFKTKKELKAENKELAYKVAEYGLKVAELEANVDSANDEINYLKHMFPFELDQVVFDVALKNAQGKYTKKNPSIKHSTITEVTVNEKNYFGLVKRYENNDVFFSKKDAEKFLKSVCK